MIDTIQSIFPKCAIVRKMGDSSEWCEENGIGEIQAQQTNGEWQWMGQDGLGSVRSVVDNGDGVERGNSPAPPCLFMGMGGVVNRLAETLAT